jgi:hypothetical protein
MDLSVWSGSSYFHASLFTYTSPRLLVSWLVEKLARKRLVDRIPHLVLSAMEAHDFRASPTSAGLPENCKKPSLGDFGSFPIAPKQTIAMLSLSLVHLGPRTVCHWWLEGVASVQDQKDPHQVWTPCILVASLWRFCVFLRSLIGFNLSHLSSHSECHLQPRAKICWVCLSSCLKCLNDTKTLNIFKI